jgi:hypothetical protein
MADFNIKPIGTEVRPVQGASLGDMINLARGAQQYQQAAQINPLEFQQKQQATRTGQIALGVEEQKDIERKNVMTLLSDPSKFTKNNRLDLDVLTPELMKIAPLTGPTVLQGLTTLTNAQTTADAAASQLNQADRALLGQPLAVFGYQGIKDPNVYAKSIKETIELNKNNPRLVALGDSYLTQLQFADPNNLPDIAIRASQNLLSPAQGQTAFAPTIQTTEGGKTVTTQPSIGATAPTATIGVAGGLQAPAQPSGAVGGPVGSGAEIAPGMRVPYPVRRADQPYTPEPTEVVDQTAGQAYRTRMVNAQGDLPTGRRNVEEVIKQANLLNENLYDIEKGGGFSGQVGRKIRMAINSADYDILAKDLAKLALSNATAMGGASNTVSGLDMGAVATGTIKMPPEKLVEIARRIQADQTNLDLQARGAQQFAQRFGDNNMKAYQQAWNANAESKVFEAINIYNAISDPKKREEQINNLLGNDPRKRQEFFDKYNNIQKLYKTGSL